MSGPAVGGAAPSSLQPSGVTGDVDDEDIDEHTSTGPKKKKLVRFDENRPVLRGIEVKRDAVTPKEWRYNMCDNDWRKYSAKSVYDHCGVKANEVTGDLVRLQDAKGRKHRENVEERALEQF